ncbi:hypothetical protein AGLY_015927 [Aphis glycines]|uniref:Uncharacterized protein n=1 Tax=Aphis glycines TaxID=307491 RepID=A0A6G0SZF4_APHGL|nr:hypothetical protein AGLY_015927 [Aphis glycines]
MMKCYDMCTTFLSDVFIKYLNTDLIKYIKKKNYKSLTIMSSKYIMYTNIRVQRIYFLTKKEVGGGIITSHWNGNFTHSHLFYYTRSPYLTCTYLTVMIIKLHNDSISGDSPYDLKTIKYTKNDIDSFIFVGQSAVKAQNIPLAIFFFEYELTIRCNVCGNTDDVILIYKIINMCFPRGIEYIKRKPYPGLR